MLKFWIVAALSAYAFAAQAETPTDEVVAVDAVWTSRVVDREPTDRLKSPAPLAPLTLWTRISGTPQALQRLERGGLPLRHVWMRQVGGELSTDTDVVVDDIALDVAGLDALRARLRQEVTKRGYFDWRTWSTKAHLTPGMWRVRLLYADRSPVPCRQGDRVIADCWIRITVGDAPRRTP